MYLNGQPIITANMSDVADSWPPFTIGNGKWNVLTAPRTVNGTIDEEAV